MFGLLRRLFQPKLVVTYTVIVATVASAVYEAFTGRRLISSSTLDAVSTAAVKLAEASRNSSEMLRQW